MEKRTAIVIGAGIVGLATARALALKGFSVKVIERNDKAIGASIRNFGMLWPIGQPDGELYERALQTKSIWKNICDEAGIWYDEVGSLHVAQQQDELNVLGEVYEHFKKDRQVNMLTQDEIIKVCPAANTENIIGGLFCKEEMIINPVRAIKAIPAYFEEKYGVEFIWSKCVSFVNDNEVYVGTHECHEADLVFICSGIDFETLYPEVFKSFPFTKCKLQMLRTIAQPHNWKMGAALCGGLSLIHYKSFAVASTLKDLRLRYQHEMSEYLDWGIHVMACQNNEGQITIGDSHEYGKTHTPFNAEKINKLITDYLDKIANFPSLQIEETWSGQYPKLTNGDTDIFYSPEPGVYIINGLGGAGMTLSFGLAEELIATI